MDWIVLVAFTLLSSFNIGSCQADEGKCNLNETVTINIKTEDSDITKHFNYTGYLNSEGKPCENGTLNWRYGVTYTGGFKDGVRHGIGTTTWNGVAEYHGEWFNDTMQGHGQLTTGDAHFKGTFRNGALYGNGSGDFKRGFRKGDVYEGHFVAGYMQNYGIYSYSDGRIYKGDFMLSTKYGVGILTWLEGFKYVGKWENGKMTGNGTIVFDFFAGKQDFTLKGTFKSSKVEGKQLFSQSRCCIEYTDARCFLLYDDGTLYHGECLEDRPHGFGKITYERHPDQDTFKYIGNWKLGKKDGQGLLYYTDKKIFLGNFVDDYIEEGMMMADGTCFNVRYNNGEEISSLNTTKKLDCNKLIFGEKETAFPSNYDVCGSNTFDDIKNINELLNTNYVDDYKIIEYDINYCKKLHGKYCNNETFYYGNVINDHLESGKLERNGTGYLKFYNGSIYYGNFKHDQMHGRGVMYNPDNTIVSGLFNFNKFQSGIILYPNMNVIASQEISPSEFMVFNFNLNNGIVGCNHSKLYKKRYGCFHEQPEKRKENNIHSYKEPGSVGFGFVHKFNVDEYSEAYTGQFSENKHSGWGFLWKDFDPILIGNFKNNQFKSGIRITHASEKTKSVSIGFWKLGRLHGPGLSIYPDRTIIGEFIVIRNKKNIKPKVMFLSQKNRKFLASINAKIPETIIMDNYKGYKL